MKSAIAGLAFALFLAGPAWAAPSAAPFLLAGRKEEPPAPGPAVTVLHLRQSAEKRVARDLLNAALRVEKTGADPQAIAAAINGEMAKALALSRKVLGVEAATGSYAIYRENPGMTPPRWRGDEALILSGRDAHALLRLAGRLQAAGLLMTSLSYAVSPASLRAVENDLTEKALLGLDRRARRIAKELQMRVLRYRDLRVGNAGTGGMPRPIFAAQLAAKAMPAPAAAPGRARVRVSVEADILLAPRRP